MIISNNKQKKEADTKAQLSDFKLGKKLFLFMR